MGHGALRTNQPRSSWDHKALSAGGCVGQVGFFTGLKLVWKSQSPVSGRVCGTGFEIVGAKKLTKSQSSVSGRVCGTAQAWGQCAHIAPSHKALSAGGCVGQYKSEEYRKKFMFASQSPVSGRVCGTKRPAELVTKQQEVTKPC